MPVVSKFAGRGKSKIFKIESEYTFIQTLGVGTYGEVKLASWVSDPSKLVAIKIAKGQTSIHMLKNEAEILKKLSHECFPQFIDFKIDEFTNKAYLIIEYFEGSTLDSYLEDHSFDEVEALNHLKLLTDAIKYLHSNKIAHRDLKPQNIIVTQDSKVKVIDFNISKRFVDRSFDEDEKVSWLNLVSWFLIICKTMLTIICIGFEVWAEVLHTDLLTDVCSSRDSFSWLLFRKYWYLGTRNHFPINAMRNWDIINSKFKIKIRCN